MSLSNKEKSNLTLYYENFLRSGLSSLEEWRSLDDQQQACLKDASERLSSERISKLAFSIQNPYFAMAVFSEVDGGDVFINTMLKKTVMESFIKYRGKVTS